MLDRRSEVFRIEIGAVFGNYFKSGFAKLVYLHGYF